MDKGTLFHIQVLTLSDIAVDTENNGGAPWNASDTTSIGSKFLDVIWFGLWCHKSLNMGAVHVRGSKKYMVMTSMISWGWNMALRMTFFVAWDSMTDLEKDTGSLAESSCYLEE